MSQGDVVSDSFQTSDIVLIRDVQTWMPIVAAAQLAKHKESERELPENWISVAEYQ